jgi:hypothetical protein
MKTPTLFLLGFLACIGLEAIAFGGLLQGQATHEGKRTYRAKYRGQQIVRIFPTDDRKISASLWSDWSSGRVNLRMNIGPLVDASSPSDGEFLRQRDAFVDKLHDCEFRAQLIGLGEFEIADVKVPMVVDVDSNTHVQQLSGSIKSKMNQDDYETFDRVAEWHLAYVCHGQ